MEKLIAQLDSLLASPRGSLSDTNSESRAASAEATTTKTAAEVFEVYEDQSKRLQDLTQENRQLQDNIWQLKIAIKNSRELHTAANSDRKAACSALMELERQLEIALREKNSLNEGLQKANKLLEEHRNKSVMDSRKLEQTQAMYDELIVKFEMLQKQHWSWRSDSSASCFRKNQLERILSKTSRVGSEVSVSIKANELKQEFDEKLEQKNREIGEQKELLEKQKQQILRQKEEIFCLQKRIEQLTEANVSPFKEEKTFRSFFRRSFKTRPKKMQSTNAATSSDINFSSKVF